jgi:glycosyltransferase involved in cell wall biosynthesis
MVGDSLDDMSSAPSVAVVIPTVCRPDLLQRAIQSATNQTQPADEIVVVVDGGDEGTVAMLRGRAIPSVRVISVPKKVGTAEARNIAIRATTCDWIAFLDDDDEWHPEKLERQSHAAISSKRRYPIVCSRVSVRTPLGEFTMPRRGPQRDETVCNYLFCRKTIFPGEVLLQSSNLFAPRSLLMQVPFRAGQRKWEDTDWLLRTQSVEGAGLEFIPAALSVWHSEDFRRHTMSGSLDSQYLFDWAVSNRELFNDRGYSGVMLVRIAQEAARHRATNLLRQIIREAVKRGSPDLVQVTWFLCGALPMTFLPDDALSVFRKALRRIGDRLQPH